MSSGQPNPSVVLFLDRTHESHLMIKMLRGIGAAFQRHGTFYKPDEDDHVWIPDVARQGWVIISGDKGIEKDGINRQSVIESKAKVFLLDDTSSKGAEWAASLVLAHKRIVRIAAENRGPFYCTVRKGSDAHVDESELRFHSGGGPAVPGPTPTDKEKSDGAKSGQTSPDFPS
ncbi:MAG: hypothetical protein ABSE36_18985 [Terracidiphilus sp.]